MHNILVVDDEIKYRNAVRRLFEEEDYLVLEAGNGVEAFNVLNDNEVDLVLLDLTMPIMDGYMFLERYRSDERHLNIPVCVMTGWADGGNRRKAINLGADDFISKPIDNTELETRIQALIRIRDYQKKINSINDELEAKVEERTIELKSMISELNIAKNSLKDAYREIILRLTSTIEFKDKNINSEVFEERNAQNKINRISQYCGVIAKYHGMSDETIEMITDAAKLMDIGNVGIPDDILGKECLVGGEAKIFEQHTVIGADILSGSNSKMLNMAEDIALNHHECYDGSGFPRGISEQEIPVAARIAAIAIEYDRLLVKEGVDCHDEVVEHMHNLAGTRIDPQLLFSFLEGQKEMLNIYKVFADA